MKCLMIGALLEFDAGHSEISEDSAAMAVEAVGLVLPWQ
jgi:hypothetical protein